MSTSYDLKCLDCGDFMGWMHNTDRMLQFMYCLRDNATKLAVMADLVEEINESREKFTYESLIVRTGDHNSSLTLNLDWFKVHAGHRIAVYNEYGDLEGDCNKRIVCGNCSHEKKCLLPLDHIESCSPISPTPRK